MDRFDTEAAKVINRLECDFLTHQVAAWGRALVAQEARKRAEAEARVKELESDKSAQFNV